MELGGGIGLSMWASGAVQRGVQCELTPVHHEGFLCSAERLTMCADAPCTIVAGPTLLAGGYRWYPVSPAG